MSFSNKNKKNTGQKKTPDDKLARLKHNVHLYEEKSLEAEAARDNLIKTAVDMANDQKKKIEELNAANKALREKYFKVHEDGEWIKIKNEELRAIRREDQLKIRDKAKKIEEQDVIIKHHEKKIKEQAIIIKDSKENITQKDQKVTLLQKINKDLQKEANWKELKIKQLERLNEKQAKKINEMQQVANNKDRLLKIAKDGLATYENDSTGLPHHDQRTFKRTEDEAPRGRMLNARGARGRARGARSRNASRGTFHPYAAATRRGY